MLGVLGKAPPPPGPFAALCLEAGPPVLSLGAPSPRPSLAQQPAWWEGGAAGGR